MQDLSYMDITDIDFTPCRYLVGVKSQVRAFAAITLNDSVVVRDFTVVQSASGMSLHPPMRPILERSACCGRRNPVRARYCNACGAMIGEARESPALSGQYEVATAYFRGRAAIQWAEAQILEEWTTAEARTKGVD